tara:strand:+ start:290 stop:1285 length:996 start_codon:yes stop_codon:yes gene_type:complete
MEFNSARTYARIEDNLVEAEKWGLKAMEAEPENSQVPWFLANEVYRPQKKKDKVAEMFKEALKRQDANLERPFKSGDQQISTVHQAIRNEAASIHNDGAKLLNRGKTNKAISKFMFSMSLNPGLIENYLVLSDIAYENNDIEEAIEYIDQASKIDNTNIQLIFRKVKYAKLDKNYDLAISTLLDIIPNDNEMKIMIDREIFMTYIDMEDYTNAISFGETLVENMLESTDIDDLVLSEASYNLAICNRYKGYELYNSVVDVINSATDDNDLLSKALKNAYSSIEYFNVAKERFFDASSFNPDDKTSANNAKELNKIVKQLKKLFIPSIEEKL